MKRNVTLSFLNDQAVRELNYILQITPIPVDKDGADKFLHIFLISP